MRAIKELADWDGREDSPKIRHLEDELAGYSRLRVGGHRVVFRETAIENERIILCLFAGPRNSVYELFAEIFLDEISSIFSSPRIESWLRPCAYPSSLRASFDAG